MPHANICHKTHKFGQLEFEKELKCWHKTTKKPNVNSILLMTFDLWQSWNPIPIDIVLAEFTT